MSAIELYSGFSPFALTIMAAGLLLASLARGYSGFGFSALLVASWSLVTEPSRAVALALVMEVAASTVQAYSVWQAIRWRRVWLLLGGAVMGMPFGVWLLAHLPASLMKVGVASFVLVLAVALLAGFKLKRTATSTDTTVVGVVSGVANGAVAMGGLPVALFLSADGDSPAGIRASLIAYFFLLDLIGLAFLAHEGILGQETFIHAIVAFPLLVTGIWFGARHFFGATAASFRRTTLCLLVGLGLIGIGQALFPVH